MRTFLVILFYLGSQYIQAQEYYNTIVPFEFGNPNALEIVEHNGDFFVPVIYFYEPYDQSTIIQISQSNEYNYLHYSDFVFATKSLNTIDDTLFAFAKNRNNLKDLRIAKLNEVFELEWNYSIETLGDYNFPSPSVSLRKKLYSSFFYEEGEVKKIGINKTNNNGLSEWTKYYEDNIGYSYLWKLLPTSDQNVLASYTLRYDYQYRSNAYLMKIDTAGEVIWRTQPMELIDGGAAPIRMAELSDSNIVLTYRKDMWDDYDFWCCLHPRPPTFIWLDSEGQFLEESIYRIPHYDELNFLDLEVGHGDYFFGYGQYRIGDDVNPDDYYGFITKYTNEGDTIWTRRYRHPDYDDYSTLHTVKDIIELENGDIVALGAITPIGEETEIWLFKVNSEGCFTQSDCDLTQISTDVKILDYNNTITLFPNPALAIVEIKGIDSDEINDIFIYSMSGEIVLKPLTPIRNQLELDISCLVSGMYVISIHTKDKNYMYKLIKN